MLFLVRHEPREVGLVLGIYACHQLYVGAESLAVYVPLLCFLRACGVCQIAVPGLPEVPVAPGPLFLAGREMVAGNVEHTRLGVVLITALKVEARIYAHIAGGHLYVLVV